ncbi:MAG: 5-bromo-4-chloroindolyl phosphate hydrolysis family protein [Alphaproteobacteria bacterium]|nr:5-bromo-4-chloroindolyl phosphate hydrolysis family protein [Alphaproteobacteria bacterium]
MSYRRRVRDDLVDVVFDVIRSASPPGAAVAGDPEAMRVQAEREAARQSARLEKQRLREEASIRQYAGVGAGLLAGGLSSLVMPTPAAVGVGLLAGGFMTMVIKAIQSGALKPRGPLFSRTQKVRAIDPPEVDGREIPKSQRDVVQSVLDDAATCLRKLDAVARSLPERDVDVVGCLQRIVKAGERLSDAVADEPVKFPLAQRVLTYHLPKAVYLAESLQAMGPEDAEKRAAEAHHLLMRMEMMFEKALVDMSSVDAAEMDLEMRLINQALDEDLNTDPRRRK